MNASKLKSYTSNIYWVKPTKKQSKISSWQENNLKIKENRSTLIKSGCVINVWTSKMWDKVTILCVNQLK